MRLFPVLLLALAIFLLFGVAWYSGRLPAMMPGPGISGSLPGGYGPDTMAAADMPR